MSAITYVFSVRSSGTPQTGLTPTFSHFKLLSDNSDLTPQPDILEIASGQYKFSYDPAINGEAAALVDAGASIADDGDRYIDMVMTVDSAKLVDGVLLASDGLDQIEPEEGINARQMLSLMGAALAGDISKEIVNGNIQVTIRAVGSSSVIRIVAHSAQSFSRTLDNFYLPS